MSLTLEDTSFLRCGICKTYPVRAYRDGTQYACENGHFVCSPCSDDGMAACGCGMCLKVVTEPDEEFTRVAPFYVKRLVHACDACSFCTLEASVLQAHAVFSCPRLYDAPDATAGTVVSRQGKCMSVVVDSDTATIECRRGVASVAVRFKSGAKVVIDATARTLSLTVWNFHPMYAVVRAHGHYAFVVCRSEQTSVPCSIPIDDTLHISVHHIFARTHPNPHDDRTDFGACRSSVVRWSIELPAVLLATIKAAVLSGCDIELPRKLDRPIGARRDKEELAMFEHAARRIFRDAYTGGLLFRVPGIVPADGSSPINDFYLYLADSSAGETSVVCPGCLHGFHFMVPTASICEHLQVNDAYIRTNASRVDIEAGGYLQQTLATRCMRWANALDFGREILPYYERVRADMMPMSGVLHMFREVRDTALPDFFGKVYSVGGRQRLISVYMEQPDNTGLVFEDEFEDVRDERPRQLRCSFCTECILLLPMRTADAFARIGAHFGLHADFISTFSRILFDRDLVSYKLKSSDLFLNISLLN